MANPVIVACPEGAWTKVATAVTGGVVYIKDNPPGGLYHTNRLTTAAAPTGLTEAVPIIDGKLTISVAASSDIYIYAKGAAGSVRVDV